MAGGPAGPGRGPALSLKARALRHLARREHARAELEDKLLRNWQAQARADERTHERTHEHAHEHAHEPAQESGQQRGHERDLERGPARVQVPTRAEPDPAWSAAPAPTPASESPESPESPDRPEGPEGPAQPPWPGTEAEARDCIAALLDDLAARGLLSETRVAESVLAARAPRFGLRRLRQTLQAKGLDAELVASTLAQARSTEFDRARALWLRRYGQAPADAAERARQMRFLAGRGFEADIIRQVLKSGDEEPAL